jgi:hypothetical protein
MHYCDTLDELGRHELAEIARECFGERFADEMGASELEMLARDFRGPHFDEWAVMDSGPMDETADDLSVWLETR